MCSDKSCNAGIEAGREIYKIKVRGFWGESWFPHPLSLSPQREGTVDGPVHKWTGR